MADIAKPVIVASKCLEFEPCRYNGQVISLKLIKRLEPYVTFIPVCPEVEIGLGVPRSPIRLVSSNGQTRLIQPATGVDMTEEMQGFSDKFLDSLPEIDAFILKSRSPSCGNKDVKIYPSTGKVAATSKGSGLFGGAVSNRYPHLAIEDEGRLNNFTIRERFLTKIFALARFRETKAAQSAKALVHYHTVNKLMLMSHNQREMRTMGQIVANHEHRPLAEVVGDYENHLRQALFKSAKKTSNINVILHAFGHFSKQLTSAEKAFFLDNLAEYRAGKIPLSSVQSVIGSWIVRFKDEYLNEQTFFEPYPKDLIEISDSGKARSY